MWGFDGQAGVGGALFVSPQWLLPPLFRSSTYMCPSTCPSIRPSIRPSLWLLGRDPGAQDQCGGGLRGG